MVRAQFSQSYEAVRSRIRRLPELYQESLEALQKRDADRLVELFRDGILQGQLRLTPLSPVTVTEKTRKGYSYPTRPLVGKGASDLNSYANMMVVTEERRGRGKRWIVTPKDEDHHEADLSLEALFRIHEFGATIHSASGPPIRIPPRPAFRYAFRRLMRERARRDDSQAVQEAIARYVRRGDRRALKIVRERRQ